MVVAISLLLLLTLGATYAFFQISVKNNTTEASVNLHAGELNSVALNQGVDSLHIKLSADDMSSSNTGDYYAVTDTSNYSRSMNTVTIASIETQGTIKDTCSGDIVVSISEGMADVLESGDTILYIKGGDIEDTLDLSTIKTEKTKTYTAYFDIDTATNTSQNIEAWLKVVNKSDAPQNYLAGLTLNLTININNFKCGVEKPIPKASDIIIENAGSQIETIANMQAREDTLRRFQGQAEDVTNNYICLGSTTECDLTDTTNSDKYSYRIIGIDTTSNQIKVIKKEALNEAYMWNSFYGDQFTWDNSELNAGINGEYFLNNETYGLYEREDNTIGSTGKSWNGIIAEHTWKYSYVSNSSSTGIDSTASGADVYKKEKELWDSGQYTGSSEKRISLMYIHDYILATKDGNNKKCVTSLSSDYKICEGNWIWLWNTNDTTISLIGGYANNYEWTMTRARNDCAWYVNSGLGGGHGISISGLEDATSVRPVFYLQSTVQLTGQGTKESPYIVTTY